MTAPSALPLEPAGPRRPHTGHPAHDVVLGRARTVVSALGRVAEELCERPPHSAEFFRELREIEEASVPRDEPKLAVEGAHAVADALQARLKQRRLPPGLFVQPGVLEGERRLIAEGREKRDLVLQKDSIRPVRDSQHSDDDALAPQRHGQAYADPGLDCPVRHLIGAMAIEVTHAVARPHGTTLGDGSPHQPDARGKHVPHFERGLDHRTDRDHPEIPAGLEQAEHRPLRAKERLDRRHRPCADFSHVEAFRQEPRCRGERLSLVPPTRRVRIRARPLGRHGRHGGRDLIHLGHGRWTEVETLARQQPGRRRHERQDRAGQTATGDAGRDRGGCHTENGEPDQQPERPTQRRFDGMPWNPDRNGPAGERRTVECAVDCRALFGLPVCGTFPRGPHRGFESGADSLADEFRPSARPRDDEVVLIDQRRDRFITERLLHEDVREGGRRKHSPQNADVRAVPEHRHADLNHRPAGDTTAKQARDRRRTRRHDARNELLAARSRQ